MKSNKLLADSGISQFEANKIGFITVGRSVLSLPFIAQLGGAVLKEWIIEYPLRLHQKRVNKFILEFIEEHEQQITKSVDIEYLRSDEFTDHLFALMEKVKVTSNKEKIQRLKQVLLSQVIDPIYNDHVKTYIEIISSMEEPEILILKDHVEYSRELLKLYSFTFQKKELIKSAKEKLAQERNRQKEGFANNVQTRENELLNLESELREVNDKLYEKNQLIKAENYDVGNELFQFYRSRLVSKGLLIQEQAVATNKVTGSKLVYTITQYGINFLNFIQSDNL